MFGTRTRVAAIAVAGLSPVRGGLSNSRAAAMPRRNRGAVKGLNSARGRPL
jgi:hypothetical protein